MKIVQKMEEENDMKIEMKEITPVIEDKREEKLDGAQQ